MTDLTKAIYTSEDAAREHLEAIRWNGKPFCPHCGGTDKIKKLEGKSTRPGVYKCNDCRKPFTVTVGTVFERSKIPLNKWLLAAQLMAASKKGISSHQIHRMLGVTYKSAWFMTHRLREAMSDTPNGPIGGSGSIVEVDETYWGTSKEKPKGARGGDHKMKVLSLVEREGNKRSFHVPNVTAKTLRPILEKHIHEETHLMTDEAAVYKGADRSFEAHSTVNHSAGEYVRITGKTIASTNTVESSFAILKRGLYGTFHHVGEQHLQRYVTEFDFRWNHRAKFGVTDDQRAAAMLKGVEGKRLMYVQPDRKTA